MLAPIPLHFVSPSVFKKQELLIHLLLSTRMAPQQISSIVIKVNLCQSQVSLDQSLQIIRLNTEDSIVIQTFGKRPVPNFRVFSP